MIKKSLVVACMSLALAACTHTPSNPITTAQADAERASAHDCLTTGTRITLKEGQCARGPGRVYSREDMERTGAVTPLEALRRLDPALQ